MRHIVSIALTAYLVTAIAGALHSKEPETSAKPTVGAQSEATDKETLERVPTITKIEYAIQTSNPPNLLITAFGKVATGGWKQVQLSRRVYITPPADGIWEYDLVGLPPSDPAIQVETIVKATNRWKDYDQSIKGVRVYGIGRGAKELHFATESKK